MDKYLLDILKESNTIIIPGLGALTITNKETGETMFMPYLQHDDGKLAAFIAEKDGIDESDAKIMVAKYVREIQAELGKGESYVMFELGTFVKADDGDIEFTHWSNSKSSAEVAEVPVAEEPIIIADEPIVEIEPEIESEGDGIELDFEIEPEPEVEIEPEVVESVSDQITEPEIEIESKIEEAPETTFVEEIAPIEEKIEAVIPVIEVPETPEIPEEIIPEVPEPEHNTEDLIIEDATPEVESEVIESGIDQMTEEEIKVKNAIQEALDNTPEPEVVAPIIPVIQTPDIPEKNIHGGTLEPSAVTENIGSSNYDEDLGAVKASNENELEAEEIEEKEKPGAKFWITIIIIGLLIIGGGAYIGRNYNELKQYVPFLADEEEAEPKSAMEELLEEIDENKNTSDIDSKIENGDKTEEGNPDEAVSDEQVTKEEPPVVPEVVEKVKPIVTPTASTSGHYHIIAGAFSSVENANRLAEEFKAKGLRSSVIKNGELNAVSMQSYATSAQANADLAKMNTIVNGAWILYK